MLYQRVLLRKEQKQQLVVVMHKPRKLKTNLLLGFFAKAKTDSSLLRILKRMNKLRESHGQKCHGTCLN